MTDGGEGGKEPPEQEGNRTIENAVMLAFFVVLVAAGIWLLGTMYDYGRISSSHVIPAFPTFISNVQVRDMWTVTGRVGYLFTPQLLGYVKGGGAWTSANYVINGTVPVTFNSENAFGASRSGWTIGGGLEWMFARGWSVFGEFNYMPASMRS